MNIKEMTKHFKKGTFYYFKNELLFNGKVEAILPLDDNSVSVEFAGGCVDVYFERVERVKRPADITANFKWCYILKNDSGECIGYIGEVKN